MKKVIIGLLLTVSVIFAAAATASAAGRASHAEQSSYFDGTFHGRIYGDKGSSAPISLRLTRDGRLVEGQVMMGSGLYVTAGMCGAGYVPSGSQFADGWVSRSNPRQLTADSTFTVNGFNVNVDLTGRASADGETLDAEAKIDLPWLCGRDPVLSGTLYRAQ